MTPTWMGDSGFNPDALHAWREAEAFYKLTNKPPKAKANCTQPQPKPCTETFFKACKRCKAKFAGSLGGYIFQN